MQWLSPVVVSLVAVASLPPSTAVAGRAESDRATAHAMNVERAKMGLLPRRAVRSRVTYLDGATSPRREAAVPSALDEQPVTLVVEDAADGAITPASGPLVLEVPQADPAPSADVSAPAAPQDVEAPPPSPPAAPTSSEAASQTVSSAPAASPPDAPVATSSDAPVADASAAPAQAASDAAAPSPPCAPAPAASDAAAQVAAATASPDAGTAPPAPVAADVAAPAGPDRPAAAVERVIDADGEIVVRLVGSGAVILGERVVGSLVDLPVLSSRRDEDGTIVQTVKDEWGVIEVRRDPVGRFLSATPVGLGGQASRSP